jgi:membrane protein involved in colicin uptake
MKALRWILIGMMIFVSFASAQDRPAGGQELSGTIKEVSINVRRVTVETAQHQERIVSVEPETRIIVNGREAKIEELKPGQAVRVVLPNESSKAILIEVT